MALPLTSACNVGISKILKFYFKVFFSVLGKALSGQLSCMWTCLVYSSSVVVRVIQ